MSRGGGRPPEFLCSRPPEFLCVVASRHRRLKIYTDTFPSTTCLHQTVLPSPFLAQWRILFTEQITICSKVFLTILQQSYSGLLAVSSMLFHKPPKRTPCPKGFPAPPGAPEGTQGCCPTTCPDDFPLPCPKGTPGVPDGFPSCCAPGKCPKGFHACPPGVAEQYGKPPGACCKMECPKEVGKLGDGLEVGRWVG